MAVLRASDRPRSTLLVLYVLVAAVAILFAAQLYVAFFLPVYTDEFGSKWGSARAFLDDGKAQLLNISCRSDPTVRWPLLWMPARWLDALMYEDLSQPTKLRAFGFLYAGIFLSALFFLARRARLGLQGAPTALVYGFAVSFCALGALPFLLVMNRPELELIVGIATLLALVLGASGTERAWPAWAALACVQYYLFAHHPNAILLMPLLVASWLAVRVPGFAKILGMLWTGTLAASLLGFYSQLLQCPLDPYVRGLFLRNTLTPELFRQFPDYFFWQAFRNLFGSLEYASNVVFRTEYMVDWLPRDPLRAYGLGALVNPAILAAWSLPLVYSVARLLAPLAARRPPAEAGDPARRAARLLLFGLFTSLALTCAAQINRNDYRSTQILLMLLLCGVLALIGQIESIRESVWRKVMGFACAVCIVSQIQFLLSFAPHALGSWRTPGRTPAQLASLNHVGYASYRADVLIAARQCGIAEDHPPDHLVLDDSTYPAFWRSRLPYHLVYLTSGWAHGIGNLKALLEERNYGGIVARCDTLPISLRRLTSESNGICCASRQAK